ALAFREQGRLEIPESRLLQIEVPVPFDNGAAVEELGDVLQHVVGLLPSGPAQCRAHEQLHRVPPYLLETRRVCVVQADEPRRQGQEFVRRKENWLVLE